LMRKFTMRVTSPRIAVGFGRGIQCLLMGILAGAGALQAGESAPESPRAVVAEASVLMDADKQKELVEGLAGSDGDEVSLWLAKWKEGEIYLYQDAEGNDMAVTLTGYPDSEGKFALAAVATGQAVTAADGTAVLMK